MTDPLQNNVFGCALAIFCEGTIVYMNPLYRACFGADFSPAPATEEFEAIFFTHPFPHVAAHALLLQEKNTYYLFAALPFAEGDAREQLLARFDRMLIDVRSLFARAVQNPPLHTMSMELIFHTVCRLAEGEFSLPFHLSGDMPEMDEYARVDLRGLFMALGILLPTMLTDGGLSISLQRLPGGRQMRWHGGKPPALPFLRHLAARLCHSSGVLLDMTEEGFSLFFPAHCPKTLSLRTPTKRLGNCLHLGFYLGE